MRTIWSWRTSDVCHPYSNAPDKARFSYICLFECKETKQTRSLIIDGFKPLHLKQCRTLLDPFITPFDNQCLHCTGRYATNGLQQTVLYVHGDCCFALQPMLVFPGECSSSCAAAMKQNHGLGQSASRARIHVCRFGYLCLLLYKQKLAS